MKPKQIQLPETFFDNVVWLVTALEKLKQGESLALQHALVDKIVPQLREQINQKLEAQQRRETFHKYKTTPRGSDEREDYRNMYLDMTGQELRTNKERKF